MTYLELFLLFYCIDCLFLLFLHPSARLDIFIQTMFSKKAAGKVPVLSVIDDGRGMTYAQMMRMVSFGHKRPNEHCNDQIGRFGIGFKVNIYHKKSCRRSSYLSA